MILSCNLYRQILAAQDEVHVANQNTELDLSCCLRGSHWLFQYNRNNYMWWTMGRGKRREPLLLLCIQDGYFLQPSYDTKRPLWRREGREPNKTVLMGPHNLRDTRTKWRK